MIEIAGGILIAVIALYGIGYLFLLVFYFLFGRKAPKVPDAPLPEKPKYIYSEETCKWTRAVN